MYTIFLIPIKIIINKVLKLIFIYIFYPKIKKIYHNYLIIRFILL